MTGQALVTATFGRRIRLLLDDGREVPGRIKGKRLQPVCGDRVLCSELPGEPEWLVTRLMPRRNELTRPDSRGRVEVLAANVDTVAVVAADLPAPDWFVVDGYLCAAELMNARGAVVFNKQDRGGPTPTSREALDEYRRAGYPVVFTSAEDGRGLDVLEQCFAGRIGVLVGQSGVGKSSLINRLSAEARRSTAPVSSGRKEGRHVTVNSAMLPVANDGAVIDSPGVREYAPAIRHPERVAQGYPEIRAQAPNCRFANCRHLREPGCAVKAAVAAGDIGARRYESYKRLLALAIRLAER